MYCNQAAHLVEAFSFFTWSAKNEDGSLVLMIECLMLGRAAIWGCWKARWAIIRMATSALKYEILTPRKWVLAGVMKDLLFMRILGWITVEEGVCRGIIGSGNIRPLPFVPATKNFVPATKKKRTVGSTRAVFIWKAQKRFKVVPAQVRNSCKKDLEDKQIKSLTKLQILKRKHFFAKESTWPLVDIWYIWLPYSLFLFSRGRPQKSYFASNPNQWALHHPSRYLVPCHDVPCFVPSDTRRRPLR